MKKCLGSMLCCSIQLLMPQLATAHSSIINNKVSQVCENQAKSDACEYTDNHEDIYRMFGTSHSPRGKRLFSSTSLRSM